MFSRREVLEVSVSRRVLWIGSAAYPLQNIARAQTVRLPPGRARAVRHWVMQIVLWLGLEFAALYAIGAAGEDPDEFAPLATYVVLGLVALSTLKVVVALVGRTYYAMVIETAGSPQTALVSTRRSEVMALVREVMDAIDDPNASFTTHIQNITNIGEQYNLKGKHNVGKQVTA